MNIGTLTVILTANTVGLTRAAKAMQQLERTTAMATAGMTADMKKAEAASLRTNTAIVNLGRSLTQFVTVPLSIMGAVSVKTFSDFEYSLAKIEGLVGVAAQQTRTWGKEVQTLAKNVGKGPNELADALYFVTSSGFKGGQAMDILNMSAKAAAAGLGETKYVADIVTSAINAYGKENLTAAKATDVLVATIREGKGEVDKMVASMGVALPLASKLGVGMDQVGAAMAGMTRSGTTVATAAVQTRQLFNSLIKPAKHSRDSIREMGSSFEELRAILRGQGLLAMFEKLQELTGGNAAKMAELFPNIRALNGILELTGKNAKEVEEIFNELSNSTGSLDAALNAVQDTAKMKLNQQWARLQVLMISLGERVAKIVIPVFNVLISVLEGIASAISTLPDPIKGFITALGLVALLAGPLVTIIKGIGSVALSFFIPSMVASGTAATGAATALAAQAAAAAIATATTAAAATAATTLAATLIAEAAAAAAAATAATGTAGAQAAQAAAATAAARATVANTEALTAQALAAAVSAKSTRLAAASMSLQADAAIKAATATGGTTKAAGFLGIATKGWIGIAIAAVAALVTLIYFLSKATVAQEALANVQKAAAEASSAQEAQIKTLTVVANNMYLSTEMRADAIKQITEISPRYLSSITAETLATKEGKKAIDTYIASLKQKATVEAAIAEKRRLYEEQGTDVALGKDADLNMWQLFKVGISSTPVNPQGNALLGIKYGFENTVKSAKAFEEAQLKMDSILRASMPTITSYKDMFGVLADNINKAAIAKYPNVDSFVKSMEGNLQQVQQAIEEVNGAIETRKVLLASASTPKAVAIYQSEINQLGALKKMYASIYEKNFSLLPIEIQQPAGEEVQALERAKKSIEEYGKALQSIGLKQKLFGDSYSKSSDLLSAYTARLNYLMETSQSVTPEMLKLAASIKEVEKAAELEGFAKSLQQIITMQKLIGIEQKLNSEGLLEAPYDAVNPLIKEYTSRLENMAAQGKGVTAEMKELYNTLKLLQTLSPQNLELDKTLIKPITETSLGGTKGGIKDFMKNSLFGGGLGWQKGIGETPEYSPEQKATIAKVEKDRESLAYLADLDGKIKALEESGGSAGMKFNFMEEKARFLKKTLDEIRATPGFDKEYISTLDEAAVAYDKINAKLQTTKVLQDAWVQSLAPLGTFIGEALGGAEKSWKDFAQMVLSTAGSVVAALLAIAIANEAASKGFIIGLAIAAVGIAATMALIGSTKDKAANMADGGIVPDGYSNDTYRANLSSQEAVIPLDRLPQLIGIGATGNNKKVEFVIEGRYLKGILEDAQMMGGIM